MAISAYNLYDEVAASPNYLSPIQLGGRNRARTAQRDRQGRMMPQSEELRAAWKLDPEHGKAGARRRWEIYRQKKANQCEQIETNQTLTGN